MNIIKYFKLLNNSDLQFVQYYYDNLIINIKQLITTNITETNEVEILLLLIPFIKNIQLLNNIQNLDDICTIQKNNEYIYSNWQYDHCYYNDKIINYSNLREQIKTNYKLLILTLENINHRLFVNWDNIYPLGVSDINNYKNSLIYKETINSVHNGTFSLHNYSDDIIRYSHIYVGTIYNILYNYFYKSDKIYNILIKNNIKTANVCSIFKIYLDDYIKLSFNDLNHWNLLNNQQQIYFLNTLNNKNQDTLYLIKFVFYGLVYSGTFSSYHEKISNNLVKQFDNDIYFLNNKTYKKTNDSFIKVINNDVVEFEQNQIKLNEFNHENLVNFKNLVSNIKNFQTTNNYIGIYGLDWISQLKFFHKYLNNRVMFITGGTGVGKSTQLPKLIIYGLKSFDYILNGKTVCTEPRRRPVKDNATIIAQQMGIHIPNNSFNSIIQYSHGLDNKHINYKNSNNLLLRIVTDGILLNELINNPTLNSNNTNIYDNIIIDESHEHNVNMDLIFSILRNSLFVNTSLKLFIISATMDYDEPLFRRYYRVINDNHKYPVCKLLNEYNLDRFDMDRRLHISKPNQDTTYKIKEYYLDLNINIKDEKIKNSKIVDIIKSLNTFKDVLIFKAGYSEISECVSLINNTFSDILAIPYVGILSTDMLNFISSLHKINKQHIKFDKSNNIMNIEKISDFYVGSSCYNHFVIVSTNIAETSITIDTLTHVIDDGIQKINVYDYKLNSYILKKTYISESNRLQRKGRVGRVNDGSVYYLYPKDFLINNKPIYKICIENILPNIFNLLTSSGKQNNFIYQNHISTNKLKDTTNNYLEHIYNFIDLSNKFDYNTLNDINGNFYIIHPNELNIDRNILGMINKQSNSINFSEYFNLYKNYKLIKFDDIVLKTTLGVLINNLAMKLFINNQNIQFTFMILYSIQFNCLHIIIKLIILLDNINNNSISITYEDINQNNKSDLLFLLNKYLNFNLSNTNNELNILQSSNIIYNQCIELLTSVKNNNFLISNCLKLINNNNNNELFKEINNLKKYDIISVILLIGFNNNIAKKIYNTNYFININNYTNIKEIYNIKNKNITVTNINNLNTILYFQNIITDTNLSIYNLSKTNSLNTKSIYCLNNIKIIHSFNFELIKYLNSYLSITSYSNIYNHNLKNTLKSIDNIIEQFKYNIQLGGSNDNIEYPLYNKFYKLDLKKIKTLKNNVNNKIIISDNKPFKNYNLYKFTYNNLYKYFIIDDKWNDNKELNLLTDYFTEKQRINCNFVNNISPLNYFVNNYENIVKNVDLSNFEQFNNYIVSKTKFCNNFRISVALTILNYFKPKKWLDISAGWGDRLIAAILYNVDEYFSVDPNTLLFNQYDNIIKTLSKKKYYNKFILHNTGFESVDIPHNNYDFVFSSPPFFDTEIYSKDKEDSLINYPNIEDWYKKFLIFSIQKALDHLCVNGILILYISLPKNYITYLIKDVNKMNTQFLKNFYYIDSTNTNMKIRNFYVWKKLNK